MTGGPRLRAELHAFCRGGRLFLVRPATLGWVALPLPVAPALALLDGRSAGEVLAGWPAGPIGGEALLTALAEAGLLDRGDAPPPPAPELGLTYVLRLTDDCNLRCHYCYAAGGHRAARMSAAILARGIDHAFSLPFEAIQFHLHGGEPTLAWDLLEQGATAIRERAVRTGRRVHLSLTTNGLLLTPPRIAWLAAHDFEVRLSFDGTPELNDRHRVSRRGRPVSRQVLQTLQLLHAQPKLRWSILATVTREASARLPELALALQELGVRSVGFIPCRHQGQATQRAQLEVEPAAYLQGLEELVGLIEAGRLTRLRVENLIRLLAALLGRELGRPRLPDARCGAGVNLLVLDPDGTLRPCDNLPRPACPPLGHVQAEDGGRGLAAFQTTIRQAACHTTAECRACPWLQACRGGCPGAAFTQGGALHDRDQLACAAARRLYPFLLERLAASPTLRDHFDHHYAQVTYRWVEARGD